MNSSELKNKEIGFGLALAVMAILALVADYFAEKDARLISKELFFFTSKS